MSRINHIQSLYKFLLQQEIDKDTLKYFAKSSLSINEIKYQITNSDEYQQKYKKIIFGKYSMFKHHISIHYHEDNSSIVNVGNYTSIAKNCNILLGTGNHHYLTGTTYSLIRIPYFKDQCVKHKHHKSGDVIIGNDVWIGTNVTIMPNITIGDGAVIGTNSLVTKNVEPYSIIGGNPAKLIKYRFPKEIIEQMMELKWWDFEDEKIIKIVPLLQQNLNQDVLDQIKEILKNE